MELTKENSEELAQSIELIKVMLHTVDLEYAKEVVKGMRKQASWQDSVAVLNMSYMSEKTDLIRTQAKMLEKLIEFIDLGKECDNMKQEISKRKIVDDKINKMFF